MHLGQDKGAVLVKKGAPKLSFHREGGRQLPPSAQRALKAREGKRPFN